MGTSPLGANLKFLNRPTFLEYVWRSFPAHKAQGGQEIMFLCCERRALLLAEPPVIVVVVLLPLISGLLWFSVQ